MIISHQHRFVFFAIPRTGTHTIRTAIHPELGSEDVEQQSLTRDVRLPIPALAQIGHGHISYREFAAHIGDYAVRDHAARDHAVRDYFTFAFVRNPYDRFVSACSFLTRHDPIPPQATTEFMKSALSRPRFRSRILIRPQSELLCDDAGNLAVNRIGYYENLQADFDWVCQRTGMKDKPLGVINASAHNSYADYYDQDLLNMINEFYLEDFEKLQYAMAGHPEEL